MRFRYSCLLACFIFGRGRQSRDKKTVMGISPYTPPPSVGPSHTPLRPPHPNHSASFGTHCLVESQMPTIGNGISVSSFLGGGEHSVSSHPIPSSPIRYCAMPTRCGHPPIPVTRLPSRCAYCQFAMCLPILQTLALDLFARASTTRGAPAGHGLAG